MNVIIRAGFLSTGDEQSPGNYGKNIYRGIKILAKNNLDRVLMD